MTLKDTLCQALDALGADSSSYTFDDHSTIVMSFDDVGDIYLDPTDNDKVWLWGITEPLDEQARSLVADALLTEVVRPVAYWESGALTLRADGRVGGLLHPEYATVAERMAEALQDFHACLARLHDIK